MALGIPLGRAAVSVNFRETLTFFPSSLCVTGFPLSGYTVTPVRRDTTVQHDAPRQLDHCALWSDLIHEMTQVVSIVEWLLFCLVTGSLPTEPHTHTHTSSMPDRAAEKANPLS